MWEHATILFLYNIPSTSSFILCQQHTNRILYLNWKLHVLATLLFLKTRNHYNSFARHHTFPTALPDFFFYKSRIHFGKGLLHLPRMEVCDRVTKIRKR